MKENEMGITRKSYHWLILSSALVVAACASNPNKATHVDTSLDHAREISSDSSVGVKDGNMVVQTKVLMSEELHDLQTEVYRLEAQTYGGLRYFDNEGLWGALRTCKTKLAVQTGEGKLQWQEPREYVVPNEDYTRIGLDDNKDIVGVEEEGVKDRLARFQSYRKILQKRYADYDDQLTACQTQLNYAAKNTTAQQ